MIFSRPPENPFEPERGGKLRRTLVRFAMSAFRTSVPAATAASDALGKADCFLDFQAQLARVARVSRPVLLVGERGTGKELAAARVHFLSPRWGGPLVKLNCAALPENLLESELFGHEAGAFTGAAKRRAGRFEMASGGTLFLDELGQMPMNVQEKILRVIEYGVFERVGGSEAVETDVRVVGATNADLPALAAAGKFRADLLDRLSFEVLHVPSLKERGAGDVELLTRHFAARMAAELGRTEPPEFAPAAWAALRDYPWPGNVRELKNVVERAVCRAEEGRAVREVVFDPFLRPGAVSSPVPAPGVNGSAAATNPDSFLNAVADFESGLLRSALVRARHRQREAADALGLSYDQFRGLYRKYAGRLEDGS